MTRSLGVVVPAYRPDADTLVRYVDALHDRLAPDELRVELDAPERGVADALADAPATVHAVPERRGKGAAITDGFERLDADVLAFADADGSTPPQSIEAVVERVRGGDADLAVGSRRHPDATVESHQTLARRRLGDAFALAARLLLDAELSDYQCGAKAISRSAWQSVREHLREPGFAWDVELVALAAALDHDIVELPVTWRDRPDSVVSPVATSLELGRALLAARHRTKHLQGSPLHSALAGLRGGRPPLVDRAFPATTDD